MRGTTPNRLRGLRGAAHEKIRQVGAFRALRAGDDRSHHHDQSLRLLLVLALRADPPGPAPLARHGVDGGVLPAALGGHHESDARVPALACGHLLLQPGHSCVSPLRCPGLRRQAASPGPCLFLDLCAHSPPSVLEPCRRWVRPADHLAAYNYSDPLSRYALRLLLP